MPELVNKAPCPVELVPMVDRHGRHQAVIIAKATWVAGADGQLELDPEQEPIRYEDEYAWDDPAKSPVRVPSDLVDEKPSTDVLVVEPIGGAARFSRVSVRVGGVRASGRVWRRWAFGPQRRDTRRRRKLAGTYDEDWIENRMPVLPADFDPRFHQAARPRQVARRPLLGDERIAVSGLYDGALRARLPGRTLLVSGRVMHDAFTAVGVLDTVLIWPERPRISLVWRHAIPCPRKVEEVRTVFAYLPRIDAALEAAKPEPEVPWVDDEEDDS